jgi:hypothetical protein
MLIGNINVAPYNSSNYYEDCQMLGKRKNAISSYKNSNVLHKLTLDEVNKVFPEKMAGIMSPRQVLVYSIFRKPSQIVNTSKSS